MNSKVPHAEVHHNYHFSMEFLSKVVLNSFVYSLINSKVLENVTFDFTVYL